MSHPENTLKEIIDRQNKKIDELINLFISYAIRNCHGETNIEQTRWLIKELKKVQKL